MSAEDNPDDDVQPTREEWTAYELGRLVAAALAVVKAARGRSGGSVYMVRREPFLALKELALQLEKRTQ